MKTTKPGDRSDTAVLASRLARTGAELAPTALAAAGLVGGGAAAVAWARKAETPGGGRHADTGNSGAGRDAE